MGIILWIVFGALAGWIASIIVRSRQGVLLDMVTGIIGAFIGGGIMAFIGYGGVTGFNAYSLLVAVLGSIILLGIVKVIRTA